MAFTCLHYLTFSRSLQPSHSLYEVFFIRKQNLFFLLSALFLGRLQAHRERGNAHYLNSSKNFVFLKAVKLISAGRGKELIETLRERMEAAPAPTRFAFFSLLDQICKVVASSSSLAVKQRSLFFFFSFALLISAGGPCH